MKKYKSLIASTLIATAMILSPSASFAESGGNAHSNSIWNRITNFFEGRTIADNDNAPTITGITAPTVLKAGEVGTWVVKAVDDNNGTLSYAVDWGDSSDISSRIFGRQSQPTFVQDATFTHSYSKDGKYTVTFTVSSSIGGDATSKVTVLIGEGTIVNAPVISNLNITNIKTNQATINWTTDVKANSAVLFSKTSPVNTSSKPDVLRNAKVLNHKIVLNRLQSNTKYYLIVKSANRNGTTTSSETSFVTLETKNDGQSPVITSLNGPKTIKVGDTETVTVNAYDPNNGTLSYGVDWGDTTTLLSPLSKLSQPTFIQSTTFSHVYNTVGTYTATFTVTDTDGNKDTSSMKIEVTPTSVDNVNPVISNVRVLTGTSTSTIYWNTDETTKSVVYYSPNTHVDVNDSNTPSVINNSFTKGHSLNISGLTSNTIYHFVIKSVDASNNTTISSEYAFITN